MSDPYRSDAYRLGETSPSTARGRLTGQVNGAKDKLLDGFSRLVDAAEDQIHRAPTDIQPAARKGVAFARDRPLATMAGLAAIGLMLVRGNRRR